MLLIFILHTFNILAVLLLIIVYVNDMNEDNIIDFDTPSPRNTSPSTSQIIACQSITLIILIHGIHVS